MIPQILTIYLCTVLCLTNSSSFSTPHAVIIIKSAKSPLIANLNCLLFIKHAKINLSTLRCMHVDNCMQRVYNCISMVTRGDSMAGLLEELINPNTCR